MWWTSDGERILEGAEAALFQEALGVLVDYVQQDEDGTIWQFGVPPFDTLQYGQKLAVLARVGCGLLREDEAAPRLTAVLEGAVAVIYALVWDMVQLEIDDPEIAVQGPSWRELVLGACREREVADELPEPGCDDLEEWDLLIQCLEEGVLWDADWEGGEMHLDADPEASRRLKKLMRIDEDYYVDVPPDPSGEELEEVLATLRELTRGPAGEGEGGEDDEFLTGIEDRYYGLFVGPCGPEAAETEAQCPLVDEIGVSDEDAFGCAYEEWAEHLRADVHEAAENRASHEPPAGLGGEAPDLAERLQQVQTTGLDDGTRIEARGGGWVVVDSQGFFLADPEDADWVAEEDDEYVPVAVFDSPEAALRALEHSERAAKARAERRRQALRRLGKPDIR